MKIFEINAGNYKDPQNMDLLLQVIDIQKENYLQQDELKNSFLLTIWTRDELLTLVSKGSSFFVAVQDSKLIGYLAISSLVDFISQLDSAVRHSFDLSVLNNSKPWAYLYQGAVHRSFQKSGISVMLATEIYRKRPGTSFVSDYLLSPYFNEGSAKALEKFNFVKAGEMVLENYRGVACTKWQIVILD